MPAQYRANRKMSLLDLNENGGNDMNMIQDTSKSLNDLLSIPITTCVYSVVLSFMIIFFIITFNYFNESPLRLIDQKLIAMDTSLKTIEAFAKKSYDKSSDLARAKLQILQNRVYSNKCFKLKYGHFNPQKVTKVDVQDSKNNHQVWRASIPLYLAATPTPVAGKAFNPTFALFYGDTEYLLNPKLIFYTMKQYSIKATAGPKKVATDKAVPPAAFGMRLYTTTVPNSVDNKKLDTVMNLDVRGEFESSEVNFAALVGTGTEKSKDNIRNTEIKSLEMCVSIEGISSATKKS